MMFTRKLSMAIRCQYRFTRGLFHQNIYNENRRMLAKLYRDSAYFHQCSFILTSQSSTIASLSSNLKQSNVPSRFATVKGKEKKVVGRRDGSQEIFPFFIEQKGHQGTYHQDSAEVLCLSMFTAILLSIILTPYFVDEDKEFNIFSFINPFVVNAAKPVDIDSTKDIVIGNSKNQSRRKQLNFIADVLDISQGAVVCIEVNNHSNVNWFGMPQSSSNGSGFIVKEDGLILTNAHVVASQQRCSISVKLPDGRTFAGFVEDVDYESDLATVRVKARGLPTLQLGCSAETRIGEWVVAVGSPLNLSNTVTAGIVSSTSRGAAEIGIPNDIKYIQTDAAITFGNSGGPLINLDGEVIGVNSMKVTSGISFAIPIDHVKKFLEKAELRRVTGKGKVGRRYMGLTLLSLTEDLRKELEARTGVCTVIQGVFVWQVVQGGPAFLAGLQPGDIITKINGKKMISAVQVHDIVKTYDKLHLEVQRGNKMYAFTVVPENVP